MDKKYDYTSQKVFILHFLFRTTIYTQKLGYFSLSFLKKEE